MHSIFGRTEVFAVARTLRYRSWRCVNASRSQSTLEEKPTSVSEAKKKSDIVQVHAKEGEGFARDGPYSSAIRANGFIFVSGQIPAFSNGVLVEGTVVEKTHKMCQNASAVLKAAGSSLEKAVKVTVYFQNMAHRPKMDEVYVQYFPQKPARSSMEARALPGGASMEMDIIAME